MMIQHGRTYEEVESTLDRDHFMSAEEAKAWGIIDHVYEKREQADTDSATRSARSTTERLASHCRSSRSLRSRSSSMRLRFPQERIGARIFCTI